MDMNNGSKVYPAGDPAHRDAFEGYEEGSKRWSRVLSRVRQLGAENRCAVILVFIATLTSVAAILIVLVALIAGCYTTGTEVVQPVFVYMIWRHGDRAPIISHEKLPVDPAIFPNGIGKLTALGASQALNLGERIRHRYFEHRNATFDEVFIRSTNMTRTIKTAEAVVRAMKIPNFPIVVDMPMADDTIGNPLFACPLADEIVKSWGDDYLMRDTYDYVYKTIDRELGLKNFTHPLMDLLDCYDTYNLELPEWAKNKTIRNAMQVMSWRGLQLQYGLEPYQNQDLYKIRLGSILHNVVDQLQFKMDNHKHHNATSNNTSLIEDINDDLYFYGVSAHDITLLAILSTFNNMSDILGEAPHVDYAANIAFELYHIRGRYRIKIMYANRFNHKPRDITRYAKGCEHARGLCDAKRFLKHARPQFFKDVQMQCDKTILPKQKDGKKVKRSAGFFNGNLADVFRS